MVAVAAVSAELRAMLLNKIFEILQFLCCFVILAQWTILRNSAQNSDIPEWLYVLHIRFYCDSSHLPRHLPL